MTDLSNLFRSSTYVQPPLAKNTLRNSSLASPSVSLPVSYTQPRTTLTSSSLYNSPVVDFPISSEAKKIITYDSLVEETQWFEGQNRIQFGLKILVIALISVLFKILGAISVSSLFSIVIFSCLLLGLEHNIFGAGFFRKWAYISLIATLWVLINNTFIHFLAKINPQIASTLYYSYQSLIPSSFITIEVIVLFSFFPLLSQAIPHSFLNSIFAYPRDVVQLFGLVWKLKWTFLMVSTFLFVFTIFTVLFWTYRDYDFYYLEQILTNILYPDVILIQIALFVWTAFILHFLQRIVSSSVTRLAVTTLFNTQNKETKAPLSLELLKLTPSHSLQYSKIDFSRLLLSPSLVFQAQTKKYQRNINRIELENVFSHSLLWIVDLLISNPYALNTKIETSKFYKTYFDIFREFSQNQLGRCSAHLFQLNKQLQNLSYLKDHPKKLKQDLFFWIRIFWKQLQVLIKAIKCCSFLRVTDQIMEIIELSKFENDFWRNSTLKSEIQSINNRIQNLRKAKELNKIIREKLKQYENKTAHLLKQ